MSEQNADDKNKSKGATGQTTTPPGSTGPGQNNDPPQSNENGSDEFRIILEMDEDTKEFNQENSKKLMERNEKLINYVVQKDINEKRQNLLNQIKERNIEVYEEFKQNKTLNELEAVLKAVSKITPKIPTRDVGASSQDAETTLPNTQWDSINKKWIPG